VEFSEIHNIKWQNLIHKSGLAKRYTMPLCTTLIDLICGTGFTTNITRFSYTHNPYMELECNLTPTRENQRLHNPEYQLFGLECMCVSLDGLIFTPSSSPLRILECSSGDDTRLDVPELCVPWQDKKRQQIVKAEKYTLFYKGHIISEHDYSVLACIYTCHNKQHFMDFCCHTHILGQWIHSLTSDS
jgi:hypothetical protein